MNSDEDVRCNHHQNVAAMFVLLIALIALIPLFWLFGLDRLESVIRRVVEKLVEFLPVKVVRDDQGIPFLYRYHLFALTNNGPGLCIHHFVKSDPDRGFHDHPWNHSLSFILCGGYSERIITRDNPDPTNYKTVERKRFTFNYLDGLNTFHRVMVPEGGDAWTFFCFARRRKTWGIIGLDGKFKSMSQNVDDSDGGWWAYVKKGFGLSHHLPLNGSVISTVDIVVFSTDGHVLLIRRGKDPFKGLWAFPGGRIESSDNDILCAALRELREETSLTDLALQPSIVVGDNKRDPRGFCISHVFRTRHRDAINRSKVYVRAGDDAVECRWFPTDSLPEMAFDHKGILDKILEQTDFPE